MSRAPCEPCGERDGPSDLVGVYLATPAPWEVRIDLLVARIGLIVAVDVDGVDLDEAEQRP